MQMLHLLLSTFAVDKGRYGTHMTGGTRIPVRKEVAMRIVEMTIAGVIAVAAQMLVVGAVLI
jgi:hypothetical protein